jgi:hypothetical protein
MTTPKQELKRMKAEIERARLALVLSSRLEFACETLRRFIEVSADCGECTPATVPLYTMMNETSDFLSWVYERKFKELQRAEADAQQTP